MQVEVSSSSIVYMLILILSVREFEATPKYLSTYDVSNHEHVKDAVTLTLFSGWRIRSIAF